MSESNVLVNFRLRDKPLRIKWTATDGVPGDGYKAQVTAIVMPNGEKLAMDSSSILEHAAPDPSGGLGGYQITFNGIVGYAADHPDRKVVDALGDAEIEVDYEFDMMRDRDGEPAALDQDYRVTDRPRASATKLTARAPAAAK